MDWIKLTQERSLRGP